MLILLSRIMMGKTVVVVPDQHAHPDYNNDRATWVGKLIADIRPNTVVNLGDCADLPSLCSYDKGKRSFQGRSYRKDIDSHLDFQDRMWYEVKKRKKRLPLRVVLEGNHEHRIEKALDQSPELSGTISFSDLELERYYDIVVRYTGGTPGVYEEDGIRYAHYFVSGVMGRPISGEHPAYSLLSKNFTSSTVGHIHTADHCYRTRADGRKIQGLVAGVYQDYISEWAGDSNKFWYRGLCIKRQVEDGNYDLEWVSIDKLKKEYDK